MKPNFTLGMKNKSPQSSIRVGGHEFHWHIHRQPQWCTADGWLGLAIHVELADEPQRSLIIEFPFTITGSRSVPYRQRPSVSSKQLAAIIAAAMQAGWEPTSRGKSFSFHVAANTQQGIQADGFATA